MTALDESFRTSRAKLRDQVATRAVSVWDQFHGNRNQYLAKVLIEVEGGQRAMVMLTSGYLTAKAREAGVAASHKAIAPGDYIVSKLRGTEAVAVYARPYGALYGQLNAGADESTAQQSARDAVSKLAATDIHMSYTASAAAWMQGDEAIGAFQRVPSGTCDYCEAAAQGLYHPSVQMPIHENCECDLEPLFGAAAIAATGLAFHSGDAGAVAPQDAGDLESRLETTGDVPAPPKKRRRH
jgi:hypothetical protein